MRNFTFLLILLLSFTKLSFSQDNVKNDFSANKQLDLNDSIKLGLSYIPEVNFKNKSFNDYVIVLMNKKSQLLVDDEKSSLDKVQKKVYNNFRNKTSPKLEMTSTDLLKSGYQVTRIYVQKDVGTNPEDYKKLIKILSLSIKNLQDFYSSKVFGKSFSTLNEKDKVRISNLIESKLYIMKDKNIK